MISAVQKQNESEREQLLARLAELEKQSYDPKAPLTGTYDKLQGKVVILADVAIKDAITELTDLYDQARHKFAMRTTTIKKLGGTALVRASNALEIGDALTAITTARKQLQALLIAPRPKDLDALLAGLLEPIRQAVRDLGKS